MIKKISQSMHTEAGKIIISIILGIGLSSLFRKTCDKKNCMEFKGPKVEDVEKEVYWHDKKCYKFDYDTQNCKEGPITIA